MREVMEIAEDVLADMHFTIEKADVDTGFIRTKPLQGAQFFELWRGDTIGTFNSLEANLHSVRRTVELHIAELPGENGAKLRARCYVKVQRLSLPEHQVSSSAHAYRMFSESTSSTQRLQLRPEQQTGMAWIDLGNDTKLATEILNRTSSRLDARRSSGTGSRTSSEKR
ncbi:MAG: hypothetical protein JSU70_19215 [Phycisphaerales bacterium]|nr:MAG: hypothetical protein JSU70_19215 [Phycisphaerales bacterium]